MDPAARASSRGLIRRFGLRLRDHWGAKLIGLILGMTGFFVAYFRVLKHPVFPVTTMPLTALDRAIGLHPAALALYVSLWIYVPLGCILQKNRRDLQAYGLAATGLSVIGLAIFFFWPTAVPKLWSGAAAGPGFSLLKSVDASGNACPSLHVAFAVFTALCVGRILREMEAHWEWRVANWIWALGIVYSAIATGQHVVIDALAGTLLGMLLALPVRPAA